MRNLIVCAFNSKANFTVAKSRLGRLKMPSMAAVRIFHTSQLLINCSTSSLRALCRVSSYDMISSAENGRRPATTSLNDSTILVSTWALRSNVQLVSTSSLSCKICYRDNILGPVTKCNIFVIFTSRNWNGLLRPQ